MSIGFKTELLGADKVVAEIKGWVDKLGGSPVALVGFGTSYAVFVHEIIEARHPVGEAKFLENAANKAKSGYASKLAAATRTFARRGHPNPLASGIYAMALGVDADAVQRTPVNTGRLRASHFVAPPDGVAGTDAPSKPGGA